LRSFKNHSNKEIASVYSLNTPSVKRHVSYDKAQYFTSTKEANFIADTYGIFAIVSKCSNPPKIDMGDYIHICEGQDTLLTAQIAGGSGRLFYFWNEETASVLNSRRVWAAGTYTLKVIDEKGCVGTDTIKVSTHSYPSPKISKSADLLCEDEILQLVYSDTIPDCSVVWNFGDGTNDTVGALACSDTIFKTYPVACAAYTITLTATTRYACTAQTQTYIRTETVPQAGMLLNFLTDTIADISAVINNVCNNMIEYKWFVNGNLTSTQNNFRYHFPERKIYNISMEIASRKCSMSLDSTIEIKERAHLSFASNKRKFCEGDEIILKNTTEINYGDFMFYWKFSDGKNYTTADIADGVNKIMEKAGMYVISLTGESGGWIRTVTDTIWVYENPVVQFPDSIFTCSNNYVLFVENSIYDQYVWTDENDFYLGAYSLYIVDKNGRYKLTQTNAHGCTASDSTVAILNERIKVELGQDLIACDSITLDAGYLSEKCIWKNYAENGMGYSDTGRFYTVKESGKIVLRVEGDSTCFGTDSINISIYKKPNASLGIDTFYCSSDSVLLCIPDNEEGVSIKWNDNVNVGERWIKNRGIYSVVVSDFSGYCTDSSSVFVEEKQSPVLSIPDVVFACNGDTVTLEMWDNILAERIAWTMPDGRQTEGVVFETNEEGSYVVTVKYANGCSTSGVWNVHRQSTSAVSSFLMASEAMLGDSVFLINLSYPAPLEYIWEATNGFNSREENPVCNFYREGIYAVTLGAANNECVVSKTKQIQIGKGGDLISESSGDTVIIEDKLDDVSKIKMTGDEIICKVAPNPSKNIFKVEVENGDTYDVITSLGKNVCSGKISSKIFVINAENWRAGIYLLHIKRGKMSKVIKLIKV
jgi:hypothetical protein